MINLNNNISSAMPRIGPNTVRMPKAGGESGFSGAVKAAGKYLSKVDDAQQSSDVSIKELLTGKNEDITSVVSAVTKADMSFKLLVGVRNQLIQAYKQTMSMQL